MFANGSQSIHVLGKAVSCVTLKVDHKLTRQFELLQHHAQGFVNGHVAVVAFIYEGMHHRNLHVMVASLNTALHNATLQE